MNGNSNSNHKKIEVLYSKYWKDVCRYLRSKFTPPPDPEDIAQSAFLKLVDIDLDGISNPKSFLLKTANNLVVDYHRSPKNVLATEADMESLESEKNSDVLGPELVSMSRQEAQIVEQALLELPERDRAFVLMNRLENMTYTEIAKQANMSRSGVQKIILQSLEKCLAALRRQTGEESKVA